MVFDSQFHKVFTFPLCGIVLDHFRLESGPNKKNPIDPVDPVKNKIMKCKLFYAPINKSKII